MCALLCVCVVIFVLLVFLSENCLEELQQAHIHLNTSSSDSTFWCVN